MNRSLNTVIQFRPLNSSEFKNDANRSVFKSAYGELIEKDTAVITHGDIFHADDILAIAILATVNRSRDILVVRMHRNNLKELENIHKLKRKHVNNIVSINFAYDVDSTFMVDCGKVFNNSWAFDHHQDRSLEAASSLVARKYFTSEFMEYHKEFFKRISDIDCDKSQLEGAEHTTEFSNLVRHFNAGGNKGFIVAVNMTIGILKGMINEYIQYKITGDNYSDMIKAGNIRYSDELVDTFKWQKYAEKEGVKAIITRDRNNEKQFALMSRDTKIFVIPEGHNSLFRHNSGFLATYAKMEDAMNAVNGGQI